MHHCRFYHSFIAHTKPPSCGTNKCHLRGIFSWYISLVDVDANGNKTPNIQDIHLSP